MNKCFSKIQLVGQKKVSKQNIRRLLKLDFNPFCFFCFFFADKTSQIWWALFATIGLLRKA